MKTHLATKLILFGIILFAAAFRFYNLNWDQGFHLHPDERAIIMTTVKLQFPASFAEFLSPDSPWNPHFFAYGSFPFYLLKIIGENLSAVDLGFAQYSLINIAGRYISAFTDLITIILLFRIGRKLINNFTGILAAFFYAASVLPIQLSHFYAVDTMLTCFIIATLYQLILFYEKPSIRRAIIVGGFFGLALATKISATVLLASIGVTLCADFILIFLRHPHKPSHWLPHFPKFVLDLVAFGLIISIVAIIIFGIFEPYGIIDIRSFIDQTLKQSEMTRDAFTFPYTLQYVGKIPYLYEFKNIFFFGLGPLLTIFGISGIISLLILIHRKKKEGKWAQETILLTFFFAYTFVVGNFAIGFMRYMLPVYPLLALFGAIFIERLFTHFHINFRIKTLLTIYIAGLILIWPLSFTHIYTQKNTRVLASEWIHQFIPPGKTIAIEHWDDALPLLLPKSYNKNFIINELPVFDPDTNKKWEKMNSRLTNADYLVLSSNRGWGSIISAPERYPIMSKFYKDLFSEKLKYKKIKEFTSYPSLNYLGIPLTIPDDLAEEAFTVYDHPRVIIFKKN